MIHNLCDKATLKIGRFNDVTIENAVVYYRYQEVFYRLNIEKLIMNIWCSNIKDKSRSHIMFTQNSENIKIGKIIGWVKTKVDESNIDKDVAEILNSEPTEKVFLLMNKDLTVQISYFHIHCPLWKE